MGYLSSFTHAGRYYTLVELPQFDQWGLWFHRQVGFSRVGTLRATIVELINGSATGMTPKELRELLKLPISNTLYNTLHELLHNKQLQQQKLAGYSLYFSADPQQAAEQVARRQKQKLIATDSKALSFAEAIIAVLVEALQAGEVLAAPSIVAARLSVRGLAVTATEVEQIYSQYGLQAEKKTAEPPPTPSRR